MRILVVEDAPELQRLFQASLNRDPDFEAVISPHVGSLDEVISETDWSSFDLVISDQLLGSYNGKDLLAWVRQNHPEVKTILLTGYVTHNVQSAEADRVLFKPIGPSDLRAVVREVAGS